MGGSKVFYVLLLIVNAVNCFPNGAPAESCESLIPRHVGSISLDPAKSPFDFVADGKHFNMGTKEIAVDIGGATFKGFFVAAIDPMTQKRIGSFVKVKGTEVMPCAAITHTDPFPKLHVRLIWNPPTDVAEGDVIFVATIVKSYARYYTGMVASVPVYTDQYVKKKK